jgi:hypothetical protein
MIATYLIKQRGVKRSEAAAGAVTLIHRFGSAANLNIHLHALLFDGIYHAGAKGAPVFHPAPALTSEKLQALLGKIIATVEEPVVIERTLTHLGLCGQPPWPAARRLTVSGGLILERGRLLTRADGRLGVRSHQRVDLSKSAAAKGTTTGENSGPCVNRHVFYH